MAVPEPNAVVISRESLTEGLCTLRIAPEGWELPEFSAGQYAMVGLPASAPRSEDAEPIESDSSPDRFIQRSYSVASSNKKRDHLEFLISLVRAGDMSPRIFALEAGDEVWLSRNLSGFFTLDGVEEHKNVVFIATGSGLSPCMGILRSHFDPSGQRNMAIVHGVRNSAELAYRQELTSLSRESSRFTYLCTISRPETETAPWTGRTGYVQDIWKSSVIASEWGVEPTPDNTDIFVSGNPEMCNAMTDILLGDGYRERTFKDPGELHLERFW